MAELESGSFVINFRKSGVVRQITVPRVAVNLSSAIVAAGVASIATSATAIAGLPGTPGLIFVQNLDTTNYLRVGVDGTNWVVKLYPYSYTTPGLSWAVFPLAGTTLYGIANSAACQMNYAVFALPS